MEGCMNLRQVVNGLLAASLTACMGTYRVSPEEYVPKAHPAQIVVADNAGSVVVLDEPRIEGDQIVGVESGTPDTVSVPMKQVEDALVRHQSKGRTIALVSGLTAGAGLAVAAIITQGTGKPCKLGANKTDQAGNVIGGNTQCDTTLPDGVQP
jgi:hypothetical protein